MTTALPSLERRSPDDSQWGEALIRVDMCDRKAADVCEQLLHRYEGQGEWSLADAWCMKVVEKSHDPKQVGKLKQEAISRLHRLDAPLRTVEQKPTIPEATPIVQTLASAPQHLSSPEASAARTPRTAQVRSTPVQAVRQPVQEATQAPVQASNTEEEGAERSHTPSSRWDIRRPPLSYAEMKVLGPVLRAAAGVLMIGYSNITATLLIGWLFQPLLPQIIWWGFTYAHALGLLIGFGVTLGQWATRDSYPRIHCFLVLALDAPFSAIQTFFWLMIVASARFALPSGDVTLQTTLIIAILSIAWGVITAKFGEFFLLGWKNRR